VDIDAGADLVNAIKPLAASTRRPGAAAGLGGFAGVFDLKEAGFTDPLLLAANDGVGTKLKVAIAAGKHDTVGIDLVAMCVNDLLVQGAEPLLFLDYYATGKLDVAMASAIIGGIAEGCRQAGCALIGGESAEMPGMYADGDYDLAGFALGAVERGGLLDGSGVKAGDKLLGLASSGAHSNGFSLIRHLVDKTGLDYGAPAPFGGGEGPGETLAEALLRPTRIYVQSCLAAVRSDGVKALAHITGGGLLENLPRVLPEGLGADIDGQSWPVPALFSWLSQTGGISSREMARTFNCGIGMIAVCDASRAAETARLLRDHGESVFEIGEIRDLDKDAPVVRIDQLDF